MIRTQLLSMVTTAIESLSAQWNSQIWGIRVY